MGFVADDKVSIWRSLLRLGSSSHVEPHDQMIPLDERIAGDRSLDLSPETIARVGEEPTFRRVVVRLPNKGESHGLESCRGELESGEG
jgi:hypothetical protein